MIPVKGKIDANEVLSGLLAFYFYKYELLWEDSGLVSDGMLPIFDKKTVLGQNYESGRIRSTDSFL
jgi:hypothetical protein